MMIEYTRRLNKTYIDFERLIDELWNQVDRLERAIDEEWLKDEPDFVAIDSWTERRSMACHLIWSLDKGLPFVDLVDM